MTTKDLFDKTTLAGINLRNRLFRSATWEAMADDKGHITDRLIKVYEELAKGGASALITGYAFVIEEEQPNARMMGIYNDSFVEENKKLTEVVHQNGSTIILQVAYGGPFTGYKPQEREIWGPSAVPHKLTKVVPKEMTKDDINRLVEAFGDAALRGKQSGFDAVELHGAHGYLLNLFLMAYYNKRTDEYGGSLENRARIIYEVYENARAKVGNDYPLMIKINCSDFINDGGLIFEECREICKKLAQMGINGIEISGGSVFKPAKSERDPWKVDMGSIGKESYFAEYAKVIAKDIDIPVILAGGNRSTEVMSKILNNTDIEYFSLSRPLLSEPDLINKWEKDPTVKPRCTSCMRCFDADGNICIFDREEKNA
ncbi:MAG: NADH:flavin oxidoreductase [bacterium]|nr:NADH:flavin oxidoreductase [bacterium]